MESMKYSRLEKVLMGLVLFTFLVGTSIALTGLYHDAAETQKSTENLGTMKNPAWCMIADLDLKGGSFASPEPGNNEYIVLEFGDSIEIYQRCSKLEVK